MCECRKVIENKIYDPGWVYSADALGRYCWVSDSELESCMLPVPSSNDGCGTLSVSWTDYLRKLKRAELSILCVRSRHTKRFQLGDLKRRDVAVLMWRDWLRLLVV